MGIVYFDPYHAGSHAAFSRAWVHGSAHTVTLLTLPGRDWKWRMRHAALSGARAIASVKSPVSAIVTTDFCPVAELRGFLPERLRCVPIAVYFHEHQVGYPSRDDPDERDAHFAMTNFTSALAADAVWCNSQYLLDSMVGGLREMLRRMPSPRLLDELETIAKKATVLAPGVDDTLFSSERDAQGRPPGRSDAPLRILWNARWEHDKGADTVCATLEQLAATGVPFECDLVGPSTDAERPRLERLRDVLGGRVRRFGRQEADAYRAALAEADVVLSAARHEFYGIAVVEAVASGAMPVVPRALAYPEVLEGVDAAWHDGTAEGAARALHACAVKLGTTGSVWSGPPAGAREAVRRHGLSRTIPSLDFAAERLIQDSGRGDR